MTRRRMPAERSRDLYLGELEQLVMWAVVRLGAGAYGLAIRDELEARAARSVSRGAAYVTLDRLVRKGLLDSRLADASERRAGRPRRYFEITESGRQALRSSRRALVDSWNGIEDRIRER